MAGLFFHRKLCLEVFCMAEIQKMNGKACVKMHKREKETTKIIYKVQNNKRKVRNTNGKTHKDSI